MNNKKKWCEPCYTNPKPPKLIYSISIYFGPKPLGLMVHQLIINFTKVLNHYVDDT